MPISVEYGFSDESRRYLSDLSQGDALEAVQNFPWDAELKLFNAATDRTGPEVFFLRLPETREEVEAYAQIMKTEDNQWLIVAGATIPRRFLGIFPVKKYANIIMDDLSWLEVQQFITRFYEESRADLFSWMKKRE